MAPFNGQPSRKQQVALALAPKVAAPLSVLGSSFVLYDCLWGHRRNQSGGGMNIYHRLMIGLCTCDILMSIGLFTSTWPMPADTENVWGAVGTVEFCEAVGFIEQAGVSATMYNGSLSIYYLLRIRYNLAPKQLNKLEKWLHAIPISFGLATMVSCILLDQFNSGIFDCWIAPFPQGCDQSWNSDVIDIPCERGDNASLYQFVFDLIPKLSSILLVTVNMWLTYRAVRTQEESTRRFSMQRNTHVAHRLARQSYFYVGALYLTFSELFHDCSNVVASDIFHSNILQQSGKLVLRDHPVVVDIHRAHHLLDVTGKESLTITASKQTVCEKEKSQILH